MTQREAYELEKQRALEEMLSLLNRIDPQENAVVYVDQQFTPGVTEGRIVFDIPVQELVNALENAKNNGANYIEVNGMQLELDRINTITYNNERIYEKRTLLDIERLQEYNSREFPKQKVRHEQEYYRADASTEQHQNDSRRSQDERER